MKVIIAGSRTLFDKELIQTAVRNAPFGKFITEVVCGCAKGVDAKGAMWADERGIPVKEVHADWTQGRGAGIQRNIEMRSYADALIAIWDGKSKGTQHMISHMLRRAKPVYVLNVTIDYAHTKINP